MNSGFSDTADCSRPPADPGTADGDARLRSMVLEENKSYQRYFQDQKEDIERIARLVKLPSSNRTQRATRTEWSCNGSTYVDGLHAAQVAASGLAGKFRASTLPRPLSPCGGQWRGSCRQCI